MVGINLSTSIGDAVAVTTTTGVPATVTPTPCKSLCLQIQAATGTQFWVRSAANAGALPSNATVIAKPPDLVTTTGSIHLLDIARIIDPVIGIYSSLAGNVVLAYLYNHAYTTPETGSVLVKTILDKLLRVA